MSLLHLLMNSTAMPFCMEEAGDAGDAGAGGGEGGGTTETGGTGDATTGTDATADNTTADTTTGGDDGGADTGVQQTDSEFVLPDEHKDKPWASKVKSQDDLYKQIENLTAVAGKKNAYPEADATTEQLDEYFNGLRPESKDAYDFGEDHPNPEFAGAVGDLLFDAGLSKHQADKLIPAYQAMEKAALDEATSAEGYKAEMTGIFGEKYDAGVVAVTNEHKQHLSTEDQQLMEAIPNQYLGMIYRLTTSMQKAYGANEGGGGNHSAKGGTTSAVDVNKQRSGLRQEITDLGKGMHTAQQKQDLIDKLDATYRNQPKKR